jgi:uncharacterized protein (DUF433 family)
MSAAPNTQSTIVRTERGLSIDGTRITLYNIMDCLKAAWPKKLIQDRFDLTEQQIADVMQYIETHRAEVETEYQTVLKQAEEVRQYWEERNRERFARIAAMPPKPGQEKLLEKLNQWKAKLKSAA